MRVLLCVCLIRMRLVISICWLMFVCVMFRVGLMSWFGVSWLSRYRFVFVICWLCVCSNCSSWLYLLFIMRYWFLVGVFFSVMSGLLLMLSVVG